MKRWLSVFIFFIIWGGSQPSALAQNSKWHQFFHLEGPERRWVVFHVFKAGRAFRISQEALHLTDSLAHDTLLDGDLHDGQVDAFRHTYWMARLTQTIGWRAAKSLGKAHERANYKQFKKGLRHEENALPDKPSSDMDFYNNDAGIQLGLDNPDISPDSLQQIVIEKILAGELMILKKDTQGHYLDKNNRPIPSEQCRQWETPKVLVPSNFKRPVAKTKK